jgi:hypothetical protein
LRCGNEEIIPRDLAKALDPAHAANSSEESEEEGALATEGDGLAKPGSRDPDWADRGDITVAGNRS